MKSVVGGEGERGVERNGRTGGGGKERKERGLFSVHSVYTRQRNYVYGINMHVGMDTYERRS